MPESISPMRQKASIGWWQWIVRPAEGRKPESRFAFFNRVFSPFETGLTGAARKAHSRGTMNILRRRLLLFLFALVLGFVPVIALHAQDDDKYAAIAYSPKTGKW